MNFLHLIGTYFYNLLALTVALCIYVALVLFILMLFKFSVRDWERVDREVAEAREDEEREESNAISDG